MLKLLYLVSFLSFFTIASAQGYIVDGIVKDAQSGEVLLAATVSICNEVTITDYEGRFTLEVNQSLCQLEIRYLGYDIFKETLNLPLEDGKEFIAFLNRSSNILDQAVITASKYSQKQSESSVSLEVLKPKVISQLNASAVDVILDILPGVDVIDGQANIRGGSGYSYGSGSRVMLVMDGMPALQYDGGTSQWNDIPSENIAQVEVLKGASSVLYGSAALNGVIHFTTKTPSKIPRTKVGISYRHFFAPEDIRRQWWDKAPYETNGYFTHSRKIKKLDVSFGGFTNILRSFNQETYENRGRGYLKLAYRKSPKVKFGLNIHTNLGETSSFFYWGNALRKSYIPGDGTLTLSKLFRFKIDPSWTIFDSRGDKHAIKGRVHYTNNTNNNNQSINSLTEFLNYTYKRRFEKFNGNLITGLEGISNHTNAELYSNVQHTAYNAAAFAQWDQKLWNKLNVIMGARYELNALNNPSFQFEIDEEVVFVDASSEVESKPVFRLGLNYNPIKGTYIRSSWGQGYRYPTIAEKFTFTNAGGLEILPNPELESETGWSAEIAIRQEMKFDFVSMYIDAAAFYSEYDNMIEFGLSPDFVGAFKAQNVGDTRIPGIETSWGTQWDIGALKIRSLVGYTYINPKYRNFTEQIAGTATVDENILKYRSRHSAKSNLSIELWGVSLWFHQRYNSHMVSIDQNFETFISGIADFRSVYNKGYNILGIQVGYKYKSWNVAFNLDNITNVLYTERPALLEAPRNVSIRLEYDISHKTN